MNKYFASNTAGKWSSKYKWTIGFMGASVLVLAGCNSGGTEDIESKEIEFPHMHGVGFTEDGEQAYIPAHDGLRVLEDGEWSMAEGERHDYMGFSMVDDGFYSSGHPSASSDYGNPLGIIKSNDNGKSLEVLDLEEEIDFHAMTAGYNSHALYVFNPEPNSKMDDAGLYYSTDETETWNRSGLEGVEEDITGLAAHPDDEEVIALGTPNDVYLSQDFGETLEPLSAHINISAVSFGHNGDLFAGGIGDNVELIQVNTESGDIQEWSVPELEKDNAISYIAQNPQDEQTLIFVTAEKDIYYTEDAGETWDKLADEGESNI